MYIYLNSLHTFDIRKFGFPLQVHKDHISAVISLDYSPTGKEFVSAGYDKTIRFFTTLGRRSHEIYHTKRMQRLTDIVWSYDNRYVISSSDEMDIRIWKANASEKLGFVSLKNKWFLFLLIIFSFRKHHVKLIIFGIKIS